MKKNKYISIIAVALISLSLIATLFLDVSLASRIVSIVTTITAIIGAVSLYVQYRKDKQLNAASFLVQYSSSFYDDYNLYDIFAELEKCAKNKRYKLDYEKYSIKIVAYLEWVETLASLIERNLIDFYSIDNALAYRFFLIVNNKQVQQKEILKFKSFYRGTYYLYNRWYKYEKQRGIPIILEETGLHLTEGYHEELNVIFGDKKKRK